MSDDATPIDSAHSMQRLAEGSAALVTGGSRGIGRAVSLALAERGCRRIVVNFLQNDRAARALDDELSALGAECRLVRANVAMPDDIDRLAATAVAAFGRIDYVVHCAALTAFKPLRAVRANQWDLTMNVGARSFLLLCQQLAPHARGGSVVAVSSLGARRVLPNYGAMGVAKAALESVVRYLAAELAADGIRVNGVVGGYIDSPAMQLFPDARRLSEEALRRTPLGRHGQPEDIADAVLFLLGDHARWITGQHLIVDGGLSLW